MKNKKIFGLLLLTSLMLVGCGETPSVTPSASESSPSVSSEAPSTPSSTPSVSATPSSSETPSSASSSAAASSSSSSSESISTPDPIQHQNPLVSTINEGAVTRDYNSGFDSMVDDFSSETPIGTASANTKVESKSKLRVLVDSNNGDFPSSADASIYKMATGSYQLETYSTIGFRLRVVNGTIDYSNLVLGLRGDDAYQVYPLSLADAVNSDAEALPELGSEFVDVEICVNLSLEDDTVTYKTTSGTDSGVKVLDKILGFHLYAKDECSALIEIEQVYLTKSGEKTVIDNFARTAVNKADDTCYWRDSTGFIVSKGVTLANNATYALNNIADLASYSSLVLNILGDTTDTKIVPVLGDKDGEGVNWADLKNPNGDGVVNAVNGAYSKLVIDLEKSGLNQEGLTGFKFASNHEVTISSVYLTNMQNKEAAKEYPHIDTASAVAFDSFSRTQGKIDPDYDSGSTNQAVLDAGLYYSISYHNNTSVSVDGDALKFTATAADDYIQVSEGSSHLRTNQKYMVFSMKLGEGASLDNFRIKTAQASDVYYASSWLAGPGLASVPEDKESYPYIDGDGYTYYIIDLEESGMDVSDYLDLYYTGAGELLIDSIFFADDYVNYETTVVDTSEHTIDTSGYAYATGIAVDQTVEKISFHAVGDGTASLISLRVEYSGSTLWAKDANALVLKKLDGTIIDPTEIVPVEGLDVAVDLVASGFSLEGGTAHFHMGGAEGSTGTLVMSNFATISQGLYSTKLSDGFSATITATDYCYVGGIDIVYPTRYLTFTLKGDGVVNLESLRIEYAGKTIPVGDLKIAKGDGTAFLPSDAIPAEGVVMVIDLVGSGYEIAPGAMHFHMGQSGVGGDLTYSNICGVDSTIPYKAAIDAYVENPV